MAIVLSVLEEVCALTTKCNIVFVLSVQEELRLRGATVVGYRENPDICISIDVTHATDYPTVNKRIVGDVRVNDGPVIPIGPNFHNSIQQKLREIANNLSRSFQIEAIPGFSGAEAAQIQIAREGIKTGHISIPCRYMLSPVEVASYTDIKSAIDILVKFVKQDGFL